MLFPLYYLNLKAVQYSARLNFYIAASVDVNNWFTRWLLFVDNLTVKDCHIHCNVSDVFGVDIYEASVQDSDVR